MYITNEYTVLKGIDGKDVTIKPGVPFEAFEGEFTVTSYARVVNVETKEVEIVLAPGAKVKGVGKMAEVKPKATRKRSSKRESVSEGE